MPHTSRMPDVAAHSPGPYTWDDFIALDDDDRRELIDGELVEVEVPNGEHERVVALLIYFLEAWARPRKAGVTLGSGYKVRITEKRGVMPDVQFYRAGNLPRWRQGLIDGHPDIAVEIISPGGVRYDRVKKMAWYAAIGTPEYWIVDPAQRTFERLVLETGHYTIADALEGEAVVRPAGFEGLEIPLAEVWSAIDELGNE
jgi:Uma2 family endonuclease